jgi:glycerol-3-phosphate dehydrogenase subunit B
VSTPAVGSPGWAAPSYDALVIGAGLAGLSAATRLAEAGARVMLIAKGVGATHLAPATIDVLGYGADGRRVERPGEALGALDGAHPYARLGGADAVRRAIDWFASRFEGGPLGAYGYRGSLDRNVLLPTTVGAAKPSALVPATMAAGDLGAGDPMLVVGFHVLRDFHAAYLADNVTRAGAPARAVVLDRRFDGRPEGNSLGLARALERPEVRAEVAAEVAGALDGAARVGFPAGLGLDDPHGVWSDLEQRLGRPVFEIPTLPPSVPGMRVFRTLRDRLRGHGGRIVLNSTAVGATVDGDRVTSVRATAAGREIAYRARWIVLATGGVATGGITLDSRWQARETALGLPVHGAPAAGEPRFGPDYFGEHPFARVGVAVDEGLRPVGEDGDRVCANVLVAGATLAGAQPWREKSGDGLSLASGHRAAELIMEEDR